MKLDFTDAKIHSKNSKFYLTVEIPKEYNYTVDKINKILNSNNTKTLEIKKVIKSRSLDANAGLWIMCDKIGRKVQNSKDNIYAMMVRTYGIFQHIIIQAEAYEDFEKAWNNSSTANFEKKYSLCEIESTWNKKGVMWHQVKCYLGTSEYNKEQFSFLLNGVIEEAKTLDIEFYSREDLIMMLNLWEEKIS